MSNKTQLKGNQILDKSITVSDITLSGASKSNLVSLGDEIVLSNGDEIKSISLPSLVQSIKSGFNITIGGDVGVDLGGHVKWTNRFMISSAGRGVDFSSVGYYYVEMPVINSVISGFGGASNVTVNNNGILLSDYQSLYYELPIGLDSTSIPGNFKIVSFSSNIVIPHNWVLLCTVNGVNQVYFFPNGVKLKRGQSINLSAHDAVNADTIDGFHMSDITGFTHSQYAKQSSKQMYNGATFVTADVDYADYAGNAYSANYAGFADSADYATVARMDLNGNTIHTTYSPITHNHTLSGLTEKSYNSLTDKPTHLSHFVNNLTTLNGTASDALKVKIDNTIVNGASGLQFAQNYGKSGVGITDNPTNDWYHHIIMNHGNSNGNNGMLLSENGLPLLTENGFPIIIEGDSEDSSTNGNNGYYTQISSCFHNDGVYLRRMVNGSLTTQRKFILNDVEPKFNLMADGAGTTSTPKFIEINFNGWNGASSPKARIAATEQSTNLNKSDLIFSLNNGSSASNLTERMRIVGDTGNVSINNNLNVGGSGNFSSIKCDNVYSNGDITLDGFLYSNGVVTSNLISYGDISFDNFLYGNEIVCNNLHSYDYISLSGKIRCGTDTNTHQLNVGGNGAIIGNAFNYTPTTTLDLSVGSSTQNSRFLFGQSNSFYGGFVWNHNATGANATLGLGINVSGVFKQSILLKNNGDVDINAKLNVEGIDIGKFSSSGGGWINMPTTGPSGIGHGGAGVNAWIAYSQINNQWFTGALAGDINYRHTSGALNFGNSSGAMAMQIKNNNIIIGSTVDNGNKLQVTGSITATSGVTASSFKITNGESNQFLMGDGSALYNYGHGSNIMADTLDGRHGSDFAFNGGISVATIQHLSAFHAPGIYGVNLTTPYNGQVYLTMLVCYSSNIGRGVNGYTNLYHKYIFYDGKEYYRYMDDEYGWSNILRANDLDSYTLKNIVNTNVTSSRTLLLSDNGLKLNCSSSNNIVITIPHSSVVNFPVGSQIIFKRNGDGIVSFSAAANVIIHSAGSKTKLSENFAVAQLIYEGLNIWTLFGNLTT